MVEVWQFWEFEHYSNNIVRVIDAPNGLELFAVDVFEIVAPAFNDGKVTLIDAKSSQRFVIINYQVVGVSTMNALAIHSLIDIVGNDIVRQFMQWVRSNIIPVFKKEIVLAIKPNTEYLSQQINFQQKKSLANHLYLKGQKIWQVELETIELYLQLLYKRITLSTKCPYPTNHQAFLLRSYYLELVKPVLYKAQSYEQLYNHLIVLSSDLLIAQELDFYICSSLKKVNNYEWVKIVKQGLILQALKSTANSLANFGKARDLEILYFQILECFSKK
ncbi:hypothetical protein [Halotia branconii]|uniref:Uncharacterized protein n=1 Tax=Halotia branconii CENA392 TaxID=1539056 RepID=A0AAJ6NPG5_9CYAN|nr:hypothetical protein [Halotia branconii]WGV24197.1 hypothetical protein QI031_20660 [Halotia branconii CENA392]